MDDLKHDLLRKIKVLNEQIWESRATVPLINRWLSNFTGEVFDVETEHFYALFLLSQFMYFGARETRELLRSLFRDAFKYPIVEVIRKRAGDTVDAEYINGQFKNELYCTRFLGVGNPAESGTHLLYYFRQENGLPKSLFINSHEIFHYNDLKVSIRDPSVSRYVFIDDLAGSGTQAKEYSTQLVKAIKTLKPEAKVFYNVMFATSEALAEVHATTAFDGMTAVFDLDPSFRCFGPKSRYFPKHSDVDLAAVSHFCEAYGKKIVSHPLGYKSGQLLLGFHHNTPDNTLPIFWFDNGNPPWYAIFRRYPKVDW